jgi:3-oxoadipate enol-lactonase
VPYARVNGTMLHYRESGEGRVALFLHGFPLDHSMWLDQLGGLAHVRRCVAPDLRGFGRSDPISESILPMEMFADDMAAFVSALGVDKVDLVGVSMGGYIALALWELRPGLIRTLSLIDTRATGDTPEARLRRDQTIDLLLEQGREAMAGEMVGRYLSAGAAASVRARVRSMVEGTRYETIVAAQLGMRDRADRSALLPTVNVPSLVIGGENDPMTPPSEIRALAAAIPGARTVIVPESAHLPPMERPAGVNEALIELFEGRKVVWPKKGSS